MLAETTENKYQKSSGELSSAQATTRHTVINTLKYIFKRLFAILVTIAIGTFITIVAANGGGAIDKAEKSRVNSVLLRSIDAWSTPAERINELRAEMEEKEGLNLPFIPRHAYWTLKALTLNWGEVSDRAKISVEPDGVTAEDQELHLLTGHSPQNLRLKLRKRLERRLIRVAGIHGGQRALLSATRRASVPQ